MSSFLRSAACNKYHFPHKQTPEHRHAHTHINWLRQIQLTPNVWASPTASSCLCGDSWGRAGQWATLTNVQPQLHRVRKREWERNDSFSLTRPSALQQPKRPWFRWLPFLTPHSFFIAALNSQASQVQMIPSCTVASNDSSSESDMNSPWWCSLISGQQASCPSGNSHHDGLPLAWCWRSRCGQTCRAPLVQS